jgi:hypothetical protein
MTENAKDKECRVENKDDDKHGACDETPQLEEQS